MTMLRPVTQSWLSGIAAATILSMGVAEMYSRFLQLERDTVAEPDHEDPEVVVANTDTEFLAFVDDSPDAGEKTAPVILSDRETMVSLEDAR